MRGRNRHILTVTRIDAVSDRASKNTVTDRKENFLMLKRFLCTLLSAVLVCLCCLAPSAAAPASAEEPAPAADRTVIRVFETTDIHGYLMNTASTDESTFQYRMAFIAQAVNNARASAQYDEVLLINGGNNYEGTPVSNLLKGSAVRAALDAMDYDAVTIGNHEFDWGIDTVNCDPDGTVGAYEVGEFAGDPQIPVLAYNLYYAGTRDRVDFARDYVIAEKAGFRVALIGYVMDYSSQVMAAKIAPYEIDPDIDALKARIREINHTEQPDVTVVVAFGGASYIASAMEPDQVQLVTGGHNQASTGSFGYAENGIAYLESACYAQGYVTASIVIENGQVTVEDLGATALTGMGADLSLLSDTPENAANLDPMVLAISHAAWRSVKDDMNEELGYITTSVDRTRTSDNGATCAGNWITGLMLRGTRDQGTVAAFYNSGGIRTSLTIPAGEARRTVTAGDIYTINPFCNSWYVYEITGPELAQHLLNAFQNANYGDQMSGLTFTYTQEGGSDQDSGGPSGEGSSDPAKYTIVSITLSDGTQVDLTDTETTYRVCTSNYNGTMAGSVFENKDPVVPAAEAPIDNITMIQLLREEAAASDGLLTVDTGVRGVKVG